MNKNLSTRVERLEGKVPPAQGVDYVITFTDADGTDRPLSADDRAKLDAGAGLVRFTFVRPSISQGGRHGQGN
jgi:hypothetical protein